MITAAGPLGRVGVKYRANPTRAASGATALGALVGLWPSLVVAAGIESYWRLVLPSVGLGIVVLLWQLSILIRHGGREDERRASA